MQIIDQNHGPIIGPPVIQDFSPQCLEATTEILMYLSKGQSHSSSPAMSIICGLLGWQDVKPWHWQDGALQCHSAAAGCGSQGAVPHLYTQSTEIGAIPAAFKDTLWASRVRREAFLSSSVLQSATLRKRHFHLVIISEPSPPHIPSMAKSCLLYSNENPNSSISFLFNLGQSHHHFFPG